jgi:SAM-dependent methyltransferase
MLPASRDAILARLRDDDLVLDVGGWAKPFARADWTMDLLPYETRGLYGYDHGSRDEERFTAGTWVQRDICDRTPWPFADDQFDFVVCSHVLEDVRDPIFVCSELSRIAKAGYVEVPSRLEEQTWGVEGQFCGWSHHHWLIEARDGGLEFLTKQHAVHGNRRFQVPRVHRDAQPPERRVVSLFWEGTIPATERVLVGLEAIEDHLAELPQQEGSPPFPRPPLRQVARRVASRLRGR